MYVIEIKWKLTLLSHWVFCPNYPFLLTPNVYSCEFQVSILSKFHVHMTDEEDDIECKFRVYMTENEEDEVSLGANFEFHFDTSFEFM